MPVAVHDASTLPPREPLLIRARHALTCDPDHGDLPHGEVLIEDGEIVAVGRRLDAPPGTRVIDAPDAVLMPGLVDTHWHLWTSIMRSLVVDGDPELGYFPLKRRLGPSFEPEDTYWSVRLGLGEGLLGGVTTVHDWYHNVRSPADADAAIGAHSDAGVRARISIGAAEGLDDGEPIDLADLRRIAAERARPRRLTLGVAIRGPQRCPPEVYQREWAVARELDLPVTLHAATSAAEVARLRAVERISADGLLDRRALVIHAVHTSAGEHRALAQAGAFVSLSPASEMRIGMGFPPIAALLEAGVAICLSIDTLALTGTADLFSVMRLALDVARAQGAGESLLSPRRLLELATIDGARALELDDVTGSLTPGKRADVLLVRLGDLNVAPAADLPTLLVHSARPDNVELVIGDGRVLASGGRLTSGHDELRAATERCLRSLCERTGLSRAAPA